jgi:hypothetical protein
MKKIMTICVLVLMASSMAMATLATVKIKGKDGIYQAEVMSGTIGTYLTGDKFMTLCIETNEWRTPVEVEAEISVIATRNGGDVSKGYEAWCDGDPLGTEAAWIYTEFLAGTFNSFDEKYVQKAARYAEDEYTSISGDAKAIYDLAESTRPANFALGNVRVMNMLHTTDKQRSDGSYKWRIGDHAQSFLVTVPEPATMMILGLGGLLFSRRRRA